MTTKDAPVPTNPPQNKPLAIMSVDFEDYRRQELRDFGDDAAPDFPEEIERQLDILLPLFEESNIRATFFSVGRLGQALSRNAWDSIIKAGHRIGCHGHEHHRVYDLGPEGFKSDLAKAKATLEDASGAPVVSFRAPYFSCDHCEPWFGSGLAETGFQVSSSHRYSALPNGLTGTLPLPGSDGRVIEAPLCSVGMGIKRLTVIGGTYFRLLPLSVIKHLMARSRAKRFIPIVYLHNYDVDPDAAPLEYPGRTGMKRRLADRMRYTGRRGAIAKLKHLARLYQFQPVESLLDSEGQ
ncbi:MAG: DUF3473 domain-containing protein [Candidatus Hydrogenedentes bacterium]|nr:DUF3473 domain-containing protein [Candidatus Hydrogenedentota bacterium]